MTTAIITGANRGIGFHIAKALAGRGVRVIATSREATDAFAGTDVEVRAGLELRDPASIRAEVLKGCPEATEIGDRRAAIREGLSRLGDGDCLVIAGKGHEQGQIVGDTVIPFSDQDEVRTALKELGHD